MTQIYWIKKGCPVCSSDLKGNTDVKFFCKKCNVLFERRHFNPEDIMKIEEAPVEIPEDVKSGEEKVIEEVEEVLEESSEEALGETEESEVTEKVDEVPVESLDDLAEEKKEPQEKEAEYELESEEKLIASDKSDKIHHGQCHFIKKIHPENRIYLEDVEAGKEKGYDLCVCLRRKGLK